MRGASRGVENMQTVYAAVRSVKRATDNLSAPVEHMRVDHVVASVKGLAQVDDGRHETPSACIGEKGAASVPTTRPAAP